LISGTTYLTGFTRFTGFKGTIAIHPENPVNHVKRDGFLIQYEFQSKNEKIPKRIPGINGVYSLKRFTE